MITAAGRTDPGPRRRNNEDALFVDVGSGLFVIADSQGGSGAGMLFDPILRRVAESLTPRFAAVRASGTHARVELLASLLHALAMEIHLAYIAVPDYYSFGTEVTACSIDDTSYAIAHVGGCRAYLFENGGLNQITEDHRWGVEQVRAGRAAVEDIGDHITCHLPTRQLSHEPPPPFATYSGSLTAGASVLIVSDGIYRVLCHSVMARIVACNPDPADMTLQLMNAATTAGSPDNLTALAVSVRSNPVGGT